MEKIIKLVISSKATLVLLLIFTIAIAAGTFIEEIYDITTAKLIIYNAKWFEFVLVLLVINFIGSIKRYNLLRVERLPGLLFHSAFIVILIGSGVTRYFGFEGNMHIRQGETVNYITSSQPYLSINATVDNQNYYTAKPVLFGAITNNSFDFDLETKESGDVNIIYKDHLKNVVETFEEGTEGGFGLVELKLQVDGHEDVLKIKEGEIKESHGFFIAYNNSERLDAVKITGNEDGKLFLSASVPINTSKMPEMTIGKIEKDSTAELKTGYLYEPENSGIAFVLNSQLKNATSKYITQAGGNSGLDALIVDINYKGETKEATILGGDGYTDKYQSFKIDDANVQLAYGNKRIALPFEIKLNKFILERYAGSESPSSYASEVTLTDKKNGVVKNHRIFMNNILDYGGYRFFQSSYDRDEKGTILSVNHDFYGTWITYLGYFLLIVGFTLTLFSKNTRYRDLTKKITKIRDKRKNLIAVVAFGIFSISTGFSQNGVNQLPMQNTGTTKVTVEHAKKFGHLITQTFDGRFAPVNTLAYDVMHKISKKDKFDIPGKGKMDAMQVFLDLTLHPDFWKQQKIIYVREKSVMTAIGQEGKRAAFNDFFNQDGSYKLSAASEAAFIKKPAAQNKFDKEIIKLNERLEIFMQGFQGNSLTIFPVQNSKNNKWINWNDPMASVPLTGTINILNDDLQLQVFNYRNLMRLYLLEVKKAAATGSYSNANKILGYIESIQRQSDAAGILPSKAKIDKEVEYNESKIFINLKNVYGLLSILLLGFAFVDNLLRKRNKFVYYTLNGLIAILGIAFIYHTYGMGLRWYLSGHAPWSNGYEALILVSWGSILAGFSFVRFSKITLAATALLAFFTLMTASHSSYDPQLTNLQPVLKSYWLIIHVATLTISYGFLGLGFVLGLMNMVIFIFKNSKNKKRLNSIISELTFINEMVLTIGLFLATVGTFLGGIWANESWGRYWGWDAKETWALVIVIVYSIILHFRLVPKMKSMFIFNTGAVLGFSSVLMTFFGVNYYLSKGMHSYASGDTPVFPLWAWICIISIFIIIVAAGIKDNGLKDNSIKDKKVKVKK
jgi:cytochrome c-type biogenesis protein CcsB